MTKEPAVVVVGAGLSGLAVANQLRRAGSVNVTVLEAGPNLGELHEAAGGTSPPRAKRWRSATPPFFFEGSGLKARVGGRSLCWHGVVLRIEDWALASWPGDVVDALRGERRNSYSATEAELSSWSGGSLSTWPGSACPDSVMAMLSARLDTEIATVPKAVRRTGQGKWLPFSPFYGWSNGPSHTIIDEANVLGVVSLGSDVQGVDFTRKGERHRIPADAVILAAGTIENARLLYQAEAPGGTIRLSGLTDHLVQGVMLSVPRSSLDLPKAFSTEALHGFWRDEATFSNYFVQSPWSNDERIVIDLWAMGESSKDFSSVELAWRHDELEATVFSCPTADDFDLLRAQWGHLQSWASLLGTTAESIRMTPIRESAGSLQRVECEVAAGDSGPWSYTCVPGSTDHESGLLPLAGDVIDSNARSRRITGLYVTGPCLMPRAGAANPSLTTLALAGRVANQVLEDFG